MQACCITIKSTQKQPWILRVVIFQGCHMPERSTPPPFWIHFPTKELQLPLRQACFLQSIKRKHILDIQNYSKGTHCHCLFNFCVFLLQFDMTLVLPLIEYTVVRITQMDFDLMKLVTPQLPFIPMALKVGWFHILISQKRVDDLQNSDVFFFGLKGNSYEHFFAIFSEVISRWFRIYWLHILGPIHIMGVSI